MYELGPMITSVLAYLNRKHSFISPHLKKRNEIRYYISYTVVPTDPSTMRLYQLTLFAVIAVAHMGHNGNYKFKLQQGTLLPHAADNSSQLSHPQRREDDDDCGIGFEKCHGLCKYRLDICCEDGGVCGFGETCMDGGTCCENKIEIDLDKDYECSSDPSTASCRDDEESCGSGCMPSGRVCCAGKGSYCPSGYACADDNKCEPADSSAGRAQSAYQATIIGIVATLMVAFSNR
jgi:hypothetical protein